MGSIETTQNIDPLLMNFSTFSDRFAAALCLSPPAEYTRPTHHFAFARWCYQAQRHHHAQRKLIFLRVF
jgi:hypothetical protein